MIKLEFMDFEGMMEFAHKLLGGAPATPEVTPQSALVTSPPFVAQPPTPQPAPQPTPAASSAPVVQTTAQSYSLDDIARAAVTLMDSGRQGDLLGLLTSFGVEALPSLHQSQYGAFATALRGMGAQI